MHASPHHPPARWLYSVLIIAYLSLWLLLRMAEQPYWILPFGLRLGVLLITPPRVWPWLFCGELLVATGQHYSYHTPWHQLALTYLPEPALMMACVYIGRRSGIESSLDRPETAVRLLLLTMATVIVTTIGSTLLNGSMSIDANAPWIERLAPICRAMLGSYIGALLVVPALIMGFGTPAPRAELSALLRNSLLLMLPYLVSLAILMMLPAPLPQFARILSLAPVLFFAFSHGWRGACLTLILSSLDIALASQFGQGAEVTANSQLFLAVTGTGALMLGTASDALRHSGQFVAEQNHRLAAANQQLDQLARELRHAARGNLHSEEQQRRYLAAELHDELGQNLAAIQTHVQLARFRLQQAGLQDIGTAMHSILSQMRKSLHHVLNNLHPAVLDEFGLYRALADGPIRELLQVAHVAYLPELHGDPESLDDEARVALYRIAQESATNTVKHAYATEFRLTLRVRHHGGSTIAVMDIRDNGIGMPAEGPRQGRGLQGMHDRITAIGGRFRLYPGGDGAHLRVLLRIDPDTDEPPSLPD
ncbi:MASE1 domain-containing sensor histidine kinase [Frateuria aurantia]